MRGQLGGRLRFIDPERRVLAEKAVAPPQIDIEELRAYRKNLKKALSKGNPAEIKRFIGECVDKMTLHPDEVKVAIQQKTPGIVSPALYRRVVAGARLGAIHEKLENWKIEVWALPTKGRRKDLGMAAADKRSVGDAVATIATSVSGETSPTPHTPTNGRKNPIQSRTSSNNSR